MWYNCSVIRYNGGEITGKEAYSLEALPLFRDMVTAARRRTGHLQKELADALGLDARVLSRKLHGARKSFLTHVEVKHIIQILAEWNAITTQMEANRFLALMGLKPDSFSELEWTTEPLNRLEGPPHLQSPARIPVSPSISQQTFAPLPHPLTALIGREYHVQLLLDRLRDTSVRLLTLFGIGGVGKTRLALEIAHTIQREFTDGVLFLSLESLRDAALLPAMLIQAFHLMVPRKESRTDRATMSSHEEILRNFLQEKHLLLILDNVEHVPEIAPFISDLLQHAPALKIMVTSRVILHLYGESIFDVPPLTISPTDHSADPETLEQYTAIRLFLDRAKAIAPAFRLTQQNAVIVAHICSHLDGLPLAIELAAARTKVLPLATILHMLTNDTGTTFLRTTAHDVMPRHQTLEATLDWSYNLLNPQMQALFRRYSVFAGGWTIEAAQAVITAHDQKMTLDEIIEQVECLIDQSLVKRVHSEEISSGEYLEPHFQLLETIRDYTRRKLEASGEQAEIQKRHAHYYLALVNTIEAHHMATEPSVASEILVQEQENLRAALEWAIEHNEAEIALRMSNALGRFWEARMQYCEAHRWTDTVFNMPAKSLTSTRAKLLMGAARLAFWEIGYERSHELAQEALKLYESAGDQGGKIWALFQIGDTWQQQGEYTQASSYLEECLQLFKAQKDVHSYAFTLSRLGVLATHQGNLLQARQWLKEALILLHKEDDPGLLAITLIHQGILFFIQNELDQSCSSLRESLLLAQQTGNRYMIATNLLVFGCLLGSMQGPTYTARLCSAAEVLYTSMNITVPIAYRPLYDAIRDKIQAHVDKTVWETWWTEGQISSLEDICTLAISTSSPKA